MKNKKRLNHCFSTFPSHCCLNCFLGFGTVHTASGSKARLYLERPPRNSFFFVSFESWNARQEKLREENHEKPGDWDELGRKQMDAPNQACSEFPKRQKKKQPRNYEHREHTASFRTPRSLWPLDYFFFLPFPFRRIASPCSCLNTLL